MPLFAVVAQYIPMFAAQYAPKNGGLTRSVGEISCVVGNPHLGYSWIMAARPLQWAAAQRQPIFIILPGRLDVFYSWIISLSVLVGKMIIFVW